MRYLAADIKMPLRYEEAALRAAVARAAGVPPQRIDGLQVVKRSVDARKKPNIRFVLQVKFTTKAKPKGKNVRALERSTLEIPDPPGVRNPSKDGDRHVIVIGAGPAGLFAAMGLARAGVRVTLLERGKPVDTRMRDIGQLRSKGTLDPESNTCFGEGGAGAYTDGKLYTRVKHPYVRWVFKELVRLGAPRDILVDAHPHLGTDKLVRLVKSMREDLIERGVDVRFGARVTELVRAGDRVAAVRLADGDEISGSHVILAVGHSARDTLAHLHQLGVPIEAKPFAVGVRAEHPQELIDRSQYGGLKPREVLGAAAYRLTYQHPDAELDRRGVYSFCMCPGGFVVPSPTEPDHMAINGMSNANRSTAYANSGIVVQVTPEDLYRRGYDEHPLVGIAFQRDLEAATFGRTEMAYAAPAMRVTDFVDRKASGSLAPTHFRPRVEADDLWQILPEWVAEPMAAAFLDFNRKIKGYLTEEANLIAVESRTSSPVRVVRDEQRVSPVLRNLYPVGEGAGYAGGIVSAAVDGLISAETIAVS